MPAEQRDQGVRTALDRGVSEPPTANGTFREARDLLKRKQRSGHSTSEERSDDPFASPFPAATRAYPCLLRSRRRGVCRRWFWFGSEALLAGPPRQFYAKILFIMTAIDAFSSSLGEAIRPICFMVMPYGTKETQAPT